MFMHLFFCTIFKTNRLVQSVPSSFVRDKCKESAITHHVFVRLVLFCVVLSCLVSRWTVKSILKKICSAHAGFALEWRQDFQIGTWKAYLYRTGIRQCRWDLRRSLTDRNHNPHQFSKVSYLWFTEFAGQGSRHNSSATLGKRMGIGFWNTSPQI